MRSSFKVCTLRLLLQTFAHEHNKRYKYKPTDLTTNKFVNIDSNSFDV